MRKARTKTLLVELREVLRENGSFFYPFAVLMLIAGGLLAFIHTGDAILFFSDHRSYWGDLFFRYATYLGEGGLFVPATLAVLLVRHRYALVMPLLAASVSLVTQSAKMLFAHPRPYTFFRDSNMLSSVIPVEGVHMHSGWNSFPSGHSTAAFALYAFLALCLPRKAWSGFFLLILAVLAGLSRIYLVQHFLEDVFMGAALGAVLALFWYLLSFRIWRGLHSRLDGSLFSHKFKKKMTMEN
jgi:membrane-associated phospholipid phosphatase